METKELPIQFQINSIKTDEFAIIEEAFDELNSEINYSLETGFGISRVEFIACSIELKFFQDTIPFVKLKATCIFKIKKESWEKLIDADNNRVVFPAYLTDHLVMLTLGVLRGILHAKTEGTKFNKFFIPTINITELREETEIISFPLDKIEKRNS